MDNTKKNRPKAVHCLLFKIYASGTAAEDKSR